MDVNEALQWADQWTEGQTFYEGMQGWRVVCAVLAAEVRRLQAVHPPSLDDETKKLQNLLSENARLSILNHLYEQISDGREEFSAMDMDYWDSSHDKLLEAIQNKLDDDTRKMVLELLDELDTYSLDPYLSRRSKEIVKILKEKLGAGE